MDRTAAWDGFAEDLAASLRAWRRVWWLPVGSAFVGSGSFSLLSDRLQLDGEATAARPDGGDAAMLLLVAVVTLAAGLVAVAWPGLERVVYARVLGAVPEPPGQRLGRVLADQFGRFLRLGLLVLLVAALPQLIASIVGGPAARLLSLGFAVAVGVWLTFVTPELALGDRSVLRSLTLGQQLLRGRWSDIRYHALVPAVVVAVLTEAVIAAGAAFGPLGLGGVGAVTLVFKGATVRRWLRIRGEPAPEP